MDNVKSIFLLATQVCHYSPKCHFYRVQTPVPLYFCVCSQPLRRLLLIGIHFDIITGGNWSRRSVSNSFLGYERIPLHNLFGYWLAEPRWAQRRLAELIQPLQEAAEGQRKGTCIFKFLELLYLPSCYSRCFNSTYSGSCSLHRPKYEPCCQEMSYCLVGFTKILI